MPQVEGFEGSADLKRWFFDVVAHDFDDELRGKVGRSSRHVCEPEHSPAVQTCLGLVPHSVRKSFFF